MMIIKKGELDGMAEAVKERKEQLDAVYGEYSFEVPTSVEEIKEEGERMFNALQCGIWNYAHYTGEKTLVFVKESGESAIDLMIVDGAVFHAVRESNRPITPADIELIATWANEKQLSFYPNAKALSLSC